MNDVKSHGMGCNLDEARPAVLPAPQITGPRDISEALRSPLGMIGLTGRTLFRHGAEVGPTTTKSPIATHSHPLTCCNGKLEGGIVAWSLPAVETSPCR